MNVTRDVITDLLPVYFSGEASADTRAVVEEFFKQDPEFARLAQDKKSQAMLNPMPVNLPPEHEKITLARTKSLLYLRALFLSFAVLFSFLPLVLYLNIYFASEGLAYLAASGIPPLFNFMIWLVLAALGCWAGFLVTILRLRTTPR
jgi:hypothetical protein